MVVKDGTGDKLEYNVTVINITDFQQKFQQALQQQSTINPYHANVENMVSS